MPDFVDCAEQLVADGVTSPDLLSTCGRSAGGLLMGNIVNMRPDLFKAVVADVPFVDLMNSVRIVFRGLGSRLVSISALFSC